MSKLLKICALMAAMLPACAFAQVPPAAVYGWTGSTWLPFSVNSGGQLSVTASGGALVGSSIPYSGNTSGTAGTWTQVVPASATRHGCTVENTSASVEYIASAGAAPSAGFTLNPLQVYNCIDQQAIWMMSNTATQPYYGVAW